MIDIRDHGGNFGGRRKTPTAVKFISSKDMVNPFGNTSGIRGSIIDDNTLDVYQWGTLGNKSLNFETLEKADIVSTNSYLSDNFYIFGEYFIETIQASNIIKIYNKDKVFIKQMTLGMPIVVSKPVLHASPDNSYALINAYYDDYMGYIKVFKLDSNLTLSAGVDVLRGAHSWMPLSPTKMISVINDGYARIAPINTGVVEVQLKLTPNTISMAGPFLKLGRFLLRDYRADTTGNFERLYLYEYDGVNFKQISDALSIGYMPLTIPSVKSSPPLLVDPVERSVLYMGQIVTFVKKYTWFEDNITTLNAQVVQPPYYVVNSSQVFAYDFSKSKYFYAISSERPSPGRVTIIKLMLV